MSDQPQGLRVTWVKSAIGYGDDQKRTIRALGLRRLHQTVEHHDSPSVRGMVVAVRHLVKVEPVTLANAPVAKRRYRRARP
ncbi:MAG: 50S ribosomal protein L30 [Candidatus Dormiibacterota bacterium]